MRRLGLLLAVIGGLLATPLAAEEGFSARFEQIRHTPGLERPFESEGRLIWVPDQRLEWRTESPFRYQYILLQDRVIERMPGDGETVIELDDAPWLVSLNELLTAVISGDEQAIGERFSVTEADEQPDNGLRRLVLVPDDPRLAERIPRIVVDQAEYPRRIVIHEAGGGRLEIRLDDFTGELPAPLPGDGSTEDTDGAS